MRGRSTRFRRKLSDAGTHTFCGNTPTHRAFAIEGGEIVRSPIKFGHGARGSPTA